MRVFYLFRIYSTYSSSTFSRAHGVFLRNVRLDFKLGLFAKQFILSLLSSHSKPYSHSSISRIFLSEVPWRISWWVFIIETFKIINSTKILHYKIEHYEDLNYFPYKNLSIQCISFFLCQSPLTINIPKEYWFSFKGFIHLPKLIQQDV